MRNSVPVFSILLIAIFLSGGLGSMQNTVNAQSINASWQFSITGLVSKPLNFTLGDLQNMTQTNVSASLICVGSPSVVFQTGVWQGVKLWTLLTQAGISPSASKIALHAIDGFSTDLTIDFAKSDDIIVAYTLNNQPLSEVVRLVVPFHWGYKWINQITNIEAVDFDYKGTYESQGYSDEGSVTQPVPTFSPSSFPPPTSYPPPTSTPTYSATSSPIKSSTPTSNSTGTANAGELSVTYIVLGIVVAVLITIVVLALVLQRRKLKIEKPSTKGNIDLNSVQISIF